MDALQRGYLTRVTRVLLAVDEHADSVAMARVAVALFGEAAEYLAVNVASAPPGPLGGPLPYGGVYTYPYLDPGAAELTVPSAEPTDRPHLAADARSTAADVAAAAGVPARPLGDVGDPSVAILAAARANDVDVIVIGSTDKGWWRRLIDGSVAHEILRDAQRPVLLVPHRH